MMWENVYQSVRCWELPESLAMPCQSSTVPHLQIGVRPMARRMAAVSAISESARPAWSIVRAVFGSLSSPLRAMVRDILNSCMHPARIENSGRIERRLDAAGEFHHGLALRLEDFDRSSDLRWRADEGRMAAEGAGRLA